MNKLYRIIWNRALNRWAVVAEIARGRGKAATQNNQSKASREAKRNAGQYRAIIRSLPLAIALSMGILPVSLLAAPAANQLPSGGQVAQGQANINQTSSVMTIQQGTERAAINWQTFDIGSAAQVNFHQPSSSSVALNRVNSANPSQIFGQLNANGQVFLTNPNGVHFAPGASVNVGGLVATTHSMSDADFMAGNDQFYRNGASGSVTNAGDITTGLGGYVAFLAPGVRNEGVILAQSGTVVLASGERISLNMDENRLVGITASDSQIDALVENRQAVKAPDGQIILSAHAANSLLGSVVNAQGAVLEARGIQSQGGKIILGGNRVEVAANAQIDVSAEQDGGQIHIDVTQGTVHIAGELDASSQAGFGGQVVVEATEITLQSGASIDATGATGGGSVLVGGDWQGGANEERRVFDDPNTVYEATKVTIDANTKIDASAKENGDGGTVVVWSDISNPDSVTSVKGEILAQGGENGGDGGQIETSGAKLITDGVTGSAAARNVETGGKAGEWLFDPYNIEIVSSGSNTNGSFTSGTWSATEDNSKILNTSIESLLDSGTNVTVNTGTGGTQDGDITINASITATSNNSDLTFKAARNILQSSGTTITTNGGDVTYNADSGNNGTGFVELKNASIVTNGGDIIIGGGTDPTTDEAIGLHGVEIHSVSSLNAGSGSILIRGRSSGATEPGRGVRVENSTLTASGDVSITGFGGGTTGPANHGVFLSGATLNISGTGSTSITGTGGPSTGSTNFGVYITGANINGLGSGAMNITGTAGGTGASTDNDGIHISNTSTIQSGSGTMTLTGTVGMGNASEGIVFYDPNPAPTNNQTLGHTTNQTGEIILRTDLLGSTGVNVLGTGALTIEPLPAENSFDAAYTFSNITLDENLSGLTLGKASNTADVTISTATNIAGPITVYGGDITLNDNLTASGDILLSATKNFRTDDGSAQVITSNNNNISIIANSGATPTPANPPNPFTPEYGLLDLDYLTLSSGSGDILIRGDTFIFTVAENITPKIESTGGFTLEPSTGSFYGTNSGGAVQTAFFLFPDTLTSFTLGKLGNTSGISLDNALTVAGPITAYGGDITVSKNLTSTASGADVLLNSSGNIIVDTGSTLNTNGGDLVLWADSDSSEGGYILTGNNVTLDTRVGTDTTGGGQIHLAGGDDDGALGAVADDGLPDNATGGTKLPGEDQAYGILLGNARNSGVQLLSGGGDITLIGGVAADTSVTNNVHGIGAFEGYNIDAGDNGNISLYGFANNTSGSSTGSFGLDLATFGFDDSGNSSTIQTQNGTVLLFGQSTFHSTNSFGVLAAVGAVNETLTISGSVINIIGEGVDLDVLMGANLTSGSGVMTLTADTLTLQDSASLSTTGAGALTINPRSDATTIGVGGGTGVLALPQTYFWNGSTGIIKDGFSETIIGRSDASGKITIGSLTSNDSLSFINSTGGIDLTGALNSSGNTVKFTSTGAIQQTGSGQIAAYGLAFVDASSVAFNNTSNNVGTLAASGITGSLSYTDADALTIGSVNPTGISTSGTIAISTETGDLTLSENISTDSTSASAIVLNAGKSSAAGTATGGNIIVSGSPTITTGSNGRVTLYSGSVSGSSGLTALVGLGSGRFRYNSDESTINFTNSGSTALGSGLFAIYREQTTVNINYGAQTITYGEAEPGAETATGLLNGDEVTYTIVDKALSTGGSLKAGNYTVNASGVDGLGYNLSNTGGTLTVNKLTLTGSIAAGNSVYGSALTPGSATFTNLVSGDVLTPTVSVDTSGNTSTSGNLNAGSYTGIQAISVLGGADAGNYSFAGITGDYSVSQLALTGSIAAGNSVYGSALTPGAATFTNQVSGDVLTPTVSLDTSGNTSTSGNLNAGSYTGIQAISVLGGADAGNYSFAGITGNYSVSQLALDLAGSTGLNKTYDGTINMPTGMTGFGSLSGVISGDVVNVFGAPVFDSSNAGARRVQIGSVALTGAESGNYNLNWTNGSGTIDKAMLTVRANDDAKFVTQADTAGFAGVSYSGFVNGEDDTAITTAGLAISRTNAGTDIAGVYAGVLQASGLSADNYNFNYVIGDYTIVPSDQLLVRVTDVTNTYGSATAYTIDSASYLDGIAEVALGSGTGSITNNGNNNYSISDGASGSATFTISPTGASLSGANLLSVGAYQLGTTDSVTNNGGNFNDNIVFVGAHQVNTKAVTATADGGVSKTYDGTTAMTGVLLTLSGLETGDTVNVTGTGNFNSKNAGTNLAYSLNNVSLNGIDAYNYYLSDGNSFTGNDGEIIARNLNVNYVGTNRVYDGSTTASVIDSDNRVFGDTLTITESADFTDKNVGTNKTIDVTGITLGGADAGNYILSSTNATTTANITRLTSVTWVGGTTGNWFDPANWAGGAVPDLANVANVVIPDGVVVSFDVSGAVGDTQTGEVAIDSLGTAGTLTQENGALNLGNGGVTLATLTQNNGSLTSAGAVSLENFAQTGGTTTTINGANFTVNGDFSQGSSGSVEVAGNTSITDSSGGIVIGNLTTQGGTSITSTNGAISQASGTAIVSNGSTSLSASSDGSPADITLNGSGNNFVGPLDANGANITLVDGVGGLILGDITATGNLDATASNELDLSGTIQVASLALEATSGNISQSGGTLEVTTGPTNLQSGGSTTLDKANDFNGPVNAVGENISLNDINDLTLGDVTATGKLDATAAIDIVLSGSISADSLAIEATTGTIEQAEGSTLEVETGPSDLAAVSDITLGGANDFNGAVNASGANIELADTNGIELGDITATGTLGVSAQDDITQKANTTIRATGETTLASSTVGITLDSATNDFSSVNASGANIELADVNGIELGDITATGTLGVSAEDDITQKADTTIRATGETTLASTTGDITLDSATNDFGTVNASGANIELAYANGIELGDITATGTLGVSAQDDITQKADTTIRATGETTLASTTGDITLDSATNDFSSVNASGANIELADVNGIELGDITASGKLDVRASDNIEQAGNTIISVGGAANITSEGGLVNVSEVGNNFAEGVIKTDLIDTVPVVLPPTPATSNSGSTSDGSVPNTDQDVVGADPDNASGFNIPEGLVETDPNLAIQMSFTDLDSNADSDMTNGGGQTSGVIVSVNQESTAVGLNQLISVSVPRSLVTSGAGFSFEMPASVQQILGVNIVSVTRANGTPLPDWLQFNSATFTFEASAVPTDGLPLEVRIFAGDREILLVISERPED